METENNPEQENLLEFYKEKIQFVMNKYDLKPKDVRVLKNSSAHGYESFLYSQNCVLLNESMTIETIIDTFVKKGEYKRMMKRTELNEKLFKTLKFKYD